MHMTKHISFSYWWLVAWSPRLQGKLRTFDLPWFRRP